MPNVLITGASRGIGRAAALRMAKLGWDVYAGVRSPEDGKELAAQSPDRIMPVQLEVTDAADIAALDTTLPATLDGVVNNAGFAAGGPIEALPLGELRRQFEVNVFGAVAVTQAVMPRLRESRGRVVFMSSISGTFSTPMMGAYSGSKFAVEAIADAMRMELRPWHIAVVLIQPGQIDTDIWRNADQTLDEAVAALEPRHRELYAKHIKGMRKAIPMARRMAVSVESVADAVESALTARRPKARYIAGGAGARAQIMMSHLPTRVLDAAQRTMTGVPRKV